MQTFIHGDLEQQWVVTSFDERFVYAKKLVDGKTGRGRPSKFNRGEVEPLIGKLEKPEVAETPKTETVVSENSELVVTEEQLPLTEKLPDAPEEIVYASLD